MTYSLIPWRRLRRWTLVGLLATAMSIMVYLLYAWVSLLAAPGVPVIEFAEADPEIIEVITKAREQVRAHRGIRIHGAFWERCCMSTTS